MCKIGLGQWFTFQHNNDPKQTAKATPECQDKSLTVLEWPTQNPKKHLWRAVKVAAHLYAVEDLENDPDPRVRSLYRLTQKGILHSGESSANKVTL